MLQFDPKTHTYRVGEDEYTPVTKYIEIFAPFNPIAWAKSVARDRKIPISEAREITNEISRLARERGTLVHKAIEEVHKHGRDNLSVELYMIPEVQAFCAFNQTYPYTVLAAEYRVYNSDWKIAGTIDCIIDLAGTKVMLDFKTGENFTTESLYPMQFPFEDYNNCKLNKAALQLGMYRLLCDIEVEMALVLHMNPYGGYFLHEVPDFRPQLLEVLQR